MAMSAETSRWMNAWNQYRRDRRKNSRAKLPPLPHAVAEEISPHERLAWIRARDAANQPVKPTRV